ncbi:hypothetical protein F4818DRAFT_403668 [Hypoxylon cercidicola]|nr:hypothetical protein F4818DRAFT_403668 [Hypoxylon cercidicola]
MDHQTQNVLPFSQDIHPTPTVADTYKILHILKRKNLPTELALQIISLGYSPWVAKRRVYQNTYHVPGGLMPSDESNITGLYLSTGRTPGNGIRVVPHRIIFQTNAADQGWADAGGHGTYENSHTWFEASILRPFPIGIEENRQYVALEDILPNQWLDAVTRDANPLRNDLNNKGWDLVEAEDGRVTWRVCNNLTASKPYRDYKVEWRRGVQTEVEDERAEGTGDGFLELLEPGFIVVLWARAQQWNWRNRVQAATIEIEYKL